jgi:hypothetical protein
MTSKPTEPQIDKASDEKMIGESQMPITDTVAAPSIPRIVVVDRVEAVRRQCAAETDMLKARFNTPWYDRDRT